MNTFFERLKEERIRLGINQADFAEMAGVQRRAQVNYESGERTPDAKYLEHIASAGVDVLYLITGERREARVGLERPALGDRERLALAIEVVTEGLEQADRYLPPHKFSELVLAAYDLMADPVQTRDNIIQLVRRVA